MSAMIIVAVPVAVTVGKTITVSIGIIVMGSSSPNRSGCGVGSFKAPSHELTTLSIINLSLRSTPYGDYFRVVLPKVTLHSLIDTHTAEKD
jgi:hypothetical protein